MALSVVNAQLPAALSSKRNIGSSSLLRNHRVWTVLSPVPSTVSKHNSLYVKALVNDSVALYEEEIESLPHNTFPPDFVFGAASSAFQVEGATKAGGRGPSIWDTFCEKFPDKIADKSGGDPGAGSYYRYKEDVQLLADIGLKAYRFSISWPRLLPKGRGKPNPEGLKYYHNLIDELKLHGIEPYVTLFHWDVPQALEDEYGGFLSKKIVDDYKKYVNLCFEEFGNKVKNWITLNEPYMFASNGYGYGLFAPGHCTPDVEIAGHYCPVGDSLREPYKVAHNLLLAHAEAVHLYKNEFQAKQRGKIGITINSHWYEPYDKSPLNKEAQQRVLDFNVGWFLDPVNFGNYPFSMRALVGDRLPIFTEEESKKLKGSYDFLGVNYYTARYAKDKAYDHSVKPLTAGDDAQADTPTDRNGVPIGPAEPNSWVNVYPPGLRKLLLHITQRYTKPDKNLGGNNPAIYVTENGVLAYNNDGVNSPTDDIYRTEFLTSHLNELEEALRCRVNVKAYFVWSLLDSFEWRDGYTCRFGLNLVNTENLSEPDLTRTPKQSTRWLKRYLRNINTTKPAVLPVPIKLEVLETAIATKT